MRQASRRGDRTPLYEAPRPADVREPPRQGPVIATLEGGGSCSWVAVIVTALMNAGTVVTR